MAGCIFAITLFGSCKSSPSDEDIRRKIALDYPCPETILVGPIQIIDRKPTTLFLGLKGYQLLVSGEVIWEMGCNELGTILPAGYKETFNNKKVVLIKGEEGWR